MTQGDKELLFKDLCARLPYGVKVTFFNEDLTYHSEPKTLIGIECINNLNYSRLEDEDGNTTIVEFVKPYLFPISTMTEQQKQEMSSFDPFKTDEVKTLGDWAICLVKFYNKHHFDYNGLIPKGLAIDATGKNIY